MTVKGERLGAGRRKSKTIDLIMFSYDRNIIHHECRFGESKTVIVLGQKTAMVRATIRVIL
jgi:hypothetical protein